MTVEALKEFACEPLYNRGNDPASNEEKYGISDQIFQDDGHKYCGSAVDKTERTGRESPVYEFVIFNCAYDCLDNPSEE